MAASSPKGSIILKVLIVLLAVGLWQVISIPGKIWQEEEQMETASRSNMNAIYEAQNYHYGKTKSYVAADSLEKLVNFINNDSTLQTKQRLGQLTNVLSNSLNKLLDIPVIKSVLPISTSMRESIGELDFNARYLEKYEDLNAQQIELTDNLNKFFDSGSFPNFCQAALYADSLNQLLDRLSDYSLQESALTAQQHIDSLTTYLSGAEIAAVQEYWNEQKQKIQTFLQGVKKTDVIYVSSIVDRLGKFRDIINSETKALETLDIDNSVKQLQTQKDAVEDIRQEFISDNNFLITQRNGLTQLNEIDSALVKFNENDFFCPDTFDGKQRYIVQFDTAKTGVIVESPNLLGQFQANLLAAVEPVRSMPLFDQLQGVRNSLDTTISVMNTTKDNYKLAKYGTDILLGIKEIEAEMKNLEAIRMYRYSTRLSTFIDTLQNVKRLSALKPMIEDLLNPLDTLANRIENQDVAELEERLNYYGKKVQQLDSLIAASKLPARVKKNLTPFYETYKQIDANLNGVRSSINPADAPKLREAANQIEQELLKTLKGYEERVYFAFVRKHENHGYIDNGIKSWEEN